VKAQLDAADPSAVLDFEEVSLVSAEVIRFLSACESQGIQLLNCSTVIRNTDRQRTSEVADLTSSLPSRSEPKGDSHALG
jgi:hypothetical protein